MMTARIAEAIGRLRASPPWDPLRPGDGARPGFSAPSASAMPPQVAPLDKLSVVLVAIFAVISLGERLTMQDVAGIALITVGANHCAVNRPLLGSALFQANP
jgi:hypothetical protein